MESKSTDHSAVAFSDQEYSPSSPPPPLTRFIKVLTFFTVIGGFLFGYDCGIISGAMILLKKQYNLSTTWQEMIVSITIAAAAIASFAGGFLNDLLGRRRVIMMASVFFAVGGAVLAAAPNKETLLAGRLIIGVGAGFAATSCTIFIAEMAPAHARGRLVIINGCCIAGGTASSGVLAGSFSFFHWGWRAMFGIVIIPAIIQFVGFLFLPESPRWLVRHGQNQKAKDVLLKVHGLPNLAEEEYENIKSAETEQRRIEEEHKGRSMILQVLQSPAVLRALLVGCGLQFIQQMAGINTMIYYSGTIIRMAGVQSDVLTIWLAAAVSSGSFIGNLISLYLVGKFGRRTLALGSLGGLIFCLLFISSAFLLISINSPPVTIDNPKAGACASYSSCSKCILEENCGFCYLENSDKSFVNNSGSCLSVNQSDFSHSSSGRCSAADKTSDTVWAIDFCPSSMGFMALVGLVVYLLIFGQGMGPMPWLVNTEIYPTWARGFCNGCSTATNWVCNLLVSMTFLTLTQEITRYGAFLLYACIAVLGFIFLWAFLPETKDKPLEETISLFSKPLCTCTSSCCGVADVAYENLNSSSDEAEPLLKDDTAIIYNKPDLPRQQRLATL